MPNAADMGKNSKGKTKQQSALESLALATRVISSRIFRPARAHKYTVWPQSLTLFVLIMFAAVALLASFDGVIIEAIRGSNVWVLRLLASITDSVKSHYYLIPALLIMTYISMINWSGRPLQDHKYLIRAYERSAFIFAAIAIPGIAVNIAKQFVGRGRPKTFDEMGAYIFSPFEFNHTFQSFPSGHSASAGSIGMLIALYYPPIRWPILIISFVLAFARVPAGAHYPSDVAAGYLIGAIGTLVLARWLAAKSLTFKRNANQTFPTLLR